MSTASGLSDRSQPSVRLAAVPPEARGYQGQRAGLVSRVLASAVDLVVVVGTVAIGYLAVSMVLFLWDPGHFHFPAPDRTWLLTAGGVVLFCYLSVSWLVNGRTWGDFLLGLRVVNYQGEPLRVAGAVARSALCVVFPIGILWVAVSRANRSVADVVLRTSVVYAWGQ
ncbi:MAG TPA: RDD family protein [Streptosporangiaceae bacterium]|jgi:uncharacterized RDD family membrane protein YckC|nr:RDD family protein [Streptosporangiaceae bacterium]